MVKKTGKKNSFENADHSAGQRGEKSASETKTTPKLARKKWGKKRVFIWFILASVLFSLFVMAYAPRYPWGSALSLFLYKKGQCFQAQNSKHSHESKHHARQTLENDDSAAAKAVGSVISCSERIARHS